MYIGSHTEYKSEDLVKFSHPALAVWCSVHRRPGFDSYQVIRKNRSLLERKALATKIIK
jgi:hypothetical protein